MHACRWIDGQKPDINRTTAGEKFLKASVLIPRCDKQLAHTAEWWMSCCKHMTESMEIDLTLLTAESCGVGTRGQPPQNNIILCWTTMPPSQAK